MSSLRDLYAKVEIQDGASTPLNSINNLINRMVGGLQRLGNGTNSSLNGFNNMNSEVARLSRNLNDSTREITSLNRRLSASENEMQGLRSESQRMERELRGARDEITQTQSRLDQAEREAQQLRQEMQRMGQASQQANTSVMGIGSTLRGMVGLVGSVFAVHKIKEFAMAGIETAAGMKAMNSQFEQVFGEMEKTAETNLNSIAQQTGILPERLKGSFIQMAAFAKTTGADTASAMSLAERATMAAADSAAFYDRGIEDVTENLQSLLKGNFENDSALGISVTETTRNAKAMELYKKKFKDLSEAQKQLALMSMVEDGNKAAGAIGQAARESDGFENVIGNLKSSWDQLRGSMMNPFLDTVTGGMQALSSKLSSIDGEAVGMKIKKGFDLAKDVISSLRNDTGNVSEILQNFGLPKESSDNLAGFANLMRDGVTTGIEVAKTAFDGFKNVVGWALDNQELLIAGLSGIAAGFTALKVIGAVNGMLTLYRGSAFAATVATHGFNTALRLNPIGLVVTGIALLVAGGVALYRNWDTVKLKASELWATTKEKFAGIKQDVSNFVQPAIGWFDTIKQKWDGFKSSLTSFKMPEWVTTVGSTIGGAVSKVKGLVNGSHATGLANVPFDGYRAELHKGEAVLTAEQSAGLRSMGVLDSNGNGTPKVNATSLVNPVAVGTSVANVGGNGQSIQISAPIELIIQGNADDAAIQKLLNVLPNEVRRIFEEIFREKLAGIGG